MVNGRVKSYIVHEVINIKITKKFPSEIPHFYPIKNNYNYLSLENFI